MPTAVRPLEFLGGLAYAAVGGEELLLDVLRPVQPAPAPPPVVLYVHGGAWEGGNRGAAMQPWLNPLLARHGYVTAAATYRLGGEAAWPAQLDDVRAAVRWLRDSAAELGGDPERVGLWGHSAGAHLVAMHALTAGAGEQVQAVAASATPADFRREAGWFDPRDDPVYTRLVGCRGEAAERLAPSASPVCQARGGAPPFLLAHGTDDDVVPVGQGGRLRDALRAVDVPVDWLAIPGAGHDWADLPSQRGRAEGEGTFGSAALAFFDRVLRQG